MKQPQLPPLPKDNAFSKIFEGYSEQRMAERLAAKYEPKPYHMRYRVIQVLTLVASYVFNGISALTAATLVYLFAHSLTGTIWVSGAITALFLLLLEAFKRGTVLRLYKEHLQYNKLNLGLLSVAVLLSAMSIGFSYFGAEKAVHEFTADVDLLNVDSLLAPYDNRIAVLEDQKAEARATKWRGTTTSESQRTVTALTAQIASIEADRSQLRHDAEAENKQRKATHRKTTGLSAQHFALVTLLMELLFLLCAYYLELFDLRTYVELSGEASPTKSNRSNREIDQTEHLAYEETDAKIHVASTQATQAESEHITQNGQPTNAMRRIGFVMSQKEPEKEPLTQCVITQVDTSLKPCMHCGEKYRPNVTWQKFCSKECRLRHHEKKHGQRFEPSQYRRPKTTA